MADRYSKRPATVRAIRFDGTNLAECSALVGEAEIDHDRDGVPMEWMSIDTPKHYAAIASGEWIVRHDDGRFDVFTPEEFAETYQPIGGDSHA